MVGIREEEFGREWEGAGRDKMGKVNRFINYGGERPAKLGEI